MNQRRSALALLVLALLASSAVAAVQPGSSFKDPIEVEPNKFIEIESAAPPTASVTWDPVQPTDLELHEYELRNGKRICAFVSGDGARTLIITELIIDWDAKTVVKVRHIYQVGEPPPPKDPPKIEFNVSKNTIAKGEEVTLSWGTVNADRQTLNGQPVADSGAQKVRPQETTSYTLDAFQGSFKVSKGYVITVTDLPPPPITEPGLRVLIVEKDSGRRTFELGNLLADPALRKYLNANCVKGPDGKTPEWRLFDERVDTSNASPVWKGLMSRSRTSYPWIVISNGQTGFEGPLPTTSAQDIIDLVEKYRVTNG